MFEDICSGPKIKNSYAKHAVYFIYDKILTTISTNQTGVVYVEDDHLLPWFIVYNK